MRFSGKGLINDVKFIFLNKNISYGIKTNQGSYHDQVYNWIRLYGDGNNDCGGNRTYLQDSNKIHLVFSILIFNY